MSRPLAKSTLQPAATNELEGAAEAPTPEAEAIIGDLLRAEGIEPTGTPAEDLERLKTVLYGYKGAYETLNAQVGELGGYKAAYEELNAKVGELEGYKEAYQAVNARVGELAGYKAAYEELNAKVGELEGYKGAYETLNAQVGELGGYKAAYEELNAKVGELEGYRKAYQKLKREVKQFRKHAPIERSDEELATLADKPSIIVASLPKSGTKYIGAVLSRSLSYDNRDRSLYSGSFSDNTVLPEMAAEYARGGMALAAHVRCTPENMAILLDAGIDRMVLHVRDPRATLFSWMHYVRKRSILRERMPEEFYALPDQEQIDRHIDDFFIKSIGWLIEWSDFLDSDSQMRVLITTHEQLATDEAALFGSIFAFFGIAPERLRAPPKDAQRNFRSGSTTEWREAIAPAQIERMTSIMPERLFQRFGWTP